MLPASCKQVARMVQVGCQHVQSLHRACADHCKSMSLVRQRGLKSFQSCFFLLLIATLCSEMKIEWKKCLICQCLQLAHQIFQIWQVCSVWSIESPKGEYDIAGPLLQAIGNGACDDWPQGLNKVECNYDGGDCCGSNTNLGFCHTITGTLAPYPWKWKKPRINPPGYWFCILLRVISLPCGRE